MAKNFGNAGSAQTIKDVAKASAEKAQVVTIRTIGNEFLIDYPDNREDVLDTADLENSINEMGFTDPMEVTAFGQEDGKYMIVSGHRRRAAGVKCGMTSFPCIVKIFDSDKDVKNYVLLSNSQRDSAKDPLLYCGRYKLHEDYLKSINFKGKIRDEVAKRLGISTPHADRFNTMNKVILPVWDMVRGEVVGMSSVLPMAKHTEAEQSEIYNIMQEALKKGASLTRDTVKLIVDSYRDGKKTWAEIANLPRDSGMPLNGFINTEPSETREPSEHDRNGEVRREYDPIAAEADRADAEREAWEREHAGDGEDEDGGGESGEKKEKKPPLSDEEKQVKRAKDIQKELEKLNTCLSDIYTFENDEEAEETLRNMASTFIVMVDEMYNIAREHKLDNLFKTSVSDMKAKVTEY